MVDEVLTDGLLPSLLKTHCLENIAKSQEFECINTYIGQRFFSGGK